MLISLGMLVAIPRPPLACFPCFTDDTGDNVPDTIGSFGGGRRIGDMGSRMTWRQIRGSEEFRGRWVALDNCRYDASTASPVEGEIVDADEDLAALCERIRQAKRARCSIVFCN